MRSQIFRVIPDLKIVEKVVQCFNLKDLNDTKKFTKYDIVDTQNKIIDLIPELLIFYFPSKAKTCLSINKIRPITILKHFLSTVNYKLVSKATFCKKQKIMVYNIENVEYFITKPQFNSGSILIEFN